MIRRSRLEATIEGRREKERNNTSDHCVIGTRHNTSMSSSDMDMNIDMERAPSVSGGVGVVPREKDGSSFVVGHG